jgi:hypothetical protein
MKTMKEYLENPEVKFPLNRLQITPGQPQIDMVQTGKILQEVAFLQQASIVGQTIVIIMMIPALMRVVTYLAFVPKFFQKD